MLFAVPPDWPRVRFEVKFVLSRDTSNPAGASTKIPVERFAPLAWKDCAAEAEPGTVVKFPRLPGVAFRLGTTTWPLTETFRERFEDVRVTVPATGPSGTPDWIRTKIWE